MDCKGFLTYTEVDEIVDEKDKDIDRLKQEIEVISDGYSSLKSQSSNSRIKTLECQKAAIEKKFNDLLAIREKENEDRKIQGEKRKAELLERRQKTKTDIEKFIAEMRARREK